MWLHQFSIAENKDAPHCSQQPGGLRLAPFGFSLQYSTYCWDCRPAHLLTKRGQLEYCNKNVATTCYAPRHVYCALFPPWEPDGNGAANTSAGGGALMCRNKPFTNYTDYACWIYHKCSSCIKAGNVAIAGSSDCDIFEAIHDAAGGIDIPDEVAVKFGDVEDEYFSPFWDCPEREVKQ